MLSKAFIKAKNIKQITNGKQIKILSTGGNNIKRNC